MNLLEEMKELGVDTDEALDRVMGDIDTYEMLLGIFSSTVKDNPINLEEFGNTDLEPLIRKIHMFKGVTGNLSIKPLYSGYQEVLNQLRSGQTEAAGQVTKSSRLFRNQLSPVCGGIRTRKGKVTKKWNKQEEKFWSLTIQILTASC